MSSSVELTTGEVAIVDDADVGLIEKYNWYRIQSGQHIYAMTKENGESILMHRLILDPPKEKHTDHINGDGLDNRRENLRVCSRSENLCNQGSTPGSSSQYKGVYHDGSRTRTKPWRAQIRKDGVVYKLGRYTNEREAALAYDRKCKELHGDFAKTNILD